MIPTLWWWLLTGALAILFNAQLSAAWSTVLGFVANVASDARCAFRDLCDGSIQLIRKAGPVDPGKALASFVLASFAALAFWADLVIMRQSLVLIAPWPESAELLAITMVSLTAGMGFLLHNAPGWPARCGILALTLTLLGGQFLIARERVAQLNEMQASETQFEDPAGAADFIVNGERVEVGGDTASPAPSTSAENDRLSNLGGMQALQFACAEIVLIWGTVAFGTAAICWVAASPFLLLFTGLGAGAYLTARLAEAAAKAGEELLGVLEVLRSLLQRAARLEVGSWLHNWRLRSKQRRHDRDQKARDLRAEARQNEQARAQAAARSRHQHQQLALERELEATRHAHQRELLALNSELPAQLVSEIHTAIVKEVAASAKQDRELQLKRIANGLNATVTALYDRLWKALESSGLFLSRPEDQEVT